MKKKIVAGLLSVLMLAGCGTGAGNLGGSGSAADPAGQTQETNNEKPEEKPSSFEGAELSGEAVNLTEGIEVINLSAESVPDEWISSMSGASVEMLSNIMEESGEGAIILISPTSIMMAFGIAENGAGGETLSQIERTISGGVPVEQMNNIALAMANHMEGSGDVNWNVANSLWFNEEGNWEINPDFASAAKNYYDADLWRAHFNNETVRDINNWVNNETYGMIPSIIDEMPDDARMFIINALAFEGEWKEMYEESDVYENRDFHNYDGTVTSATLLRSQEDKYFKLGNGTGFTRDYKGGEYSFFGILPDEGVSVEDYIAKLANKDLDLAEAIRNQKTYEGDIYVMIPEFNMDFDIEMSDLLAQMGMPNAFDPNNADFYGMMNCLDEGEYEIWLSKVLHKTHIEVNRAGTRAAAVTALELDTCSAVMIDDQPLWITLDRPFVYGIVDNETGLPVFFGCVNSL